MLQKKKPYYYTELPDDLTLRAYGVSLITSYLHDFISKVFKSDNKFYKKKNKYYIDGLVEHNKDMLRRTEALRTLRDPELKKYPSDGITTDNLSDELESQYQPIIDFVYIYLHSGYAQLTDFGLILKNLREGKKVYTQEEVKYLLHQAITDLTRVEPANLLIEKYI